LETVFFWLSKLVWAVIAPDSILLLLVLLSWVLVLRGATRWAKRVLGVVSIGLLVLFFLPVGEWVLAPLESRFAPNPKLPQQVDGIIVLGGAEDALRTAAWDQAVVNDAAERFLASIALSRRHPEAKLLFTSGSGSPLDQEHKGAEVARKLYAELGIEPGRLIFEDQSRNTVENAVLSKAIVKPKPGETWILLTSAFHMPRSVGIFCKIGWTVVAYPVDHRTVRGHLMRIESGLIGNLDKLAVGIREWVGLAAYYFTGKTSALFPVGCP
jgi:uncharacterized SAM-binding protein YcdF (DUF218 family)